MRALHDPAGAVQRAATRALTEIGEPATGALMAALQDEDGHVRRMAADILGTLADLQAVKPLTVALTDQDSDVRRAAARALRQIGTPEALTALGAR